ncbi:pectin lyase fold/virulence factor [Bisporella sp. PMI_857]|nr:pectin lyase fold/virulence factor [Bisporella sp. PMI_857]
MDTGPEKRSTRHLWGAGLTSGNCLQLPSKVTSDLLVRNPAATQKRESWSGSKLPWSTSNPQDGPNYKSAMVSSIRAVRQAAVALLVLLGAVEGYEFTRSPNETQANSVFVWPVVNSTAVARSTAFKVNVRPDGHAKRWEPVPLYTTPVAEINVTTGSSKKYPTNYAVFDYNGNVQLSIEPNATVFPTISQVRVRPLSYGIQPVITGRKITLNLSQPYDNVVVEVNGDVFNVLTLFTNRIEENPISAQSAANDNSIVYYAPGYYNLKAPIPLKSGQTLYLAAGAYLKFPAVNGEAIQIINATNVKVRGRGYIGSAITIANSTDVSVDGAFASVGGFLITVAQRIHVRGWRSITSHQWGDGMDVYCSRDVLVERLFIRSSDDSIALYQHRWDYYGNSSNLTIRDSSLWADVAHPINIGTHGDTVNPETMDGVTIQNVDILDHREPQVDYQGAIALSVGDENLIKNILIQDVRVEDFRWGQLLSVRIMYNKKYNLAPGRGVQNLTVKGLTYQNSGKNIHNTAVISGYSDARSVDLVDIQGLTVNGLQVWDKMKKPSWYITSDFVPMIVGSFVNNLTFSAP